MSNAPIDHVGLEVVPFAECLQLLGAVQVGRVGFVSDGDRSQPPGALGHEPLNRGENVVGIQLGPSAALAWPVCAMPNGTFGPAACPRRVRA